MLAVDYENENNFFRLFSTKTAANAIIVLFSELFCYFPAVLVK